MELYPTLPCSLMACTGATLGFTVLFTVLRFERKKDVKVCQRADCCVMGKLGPRIKGSVDGIQRRIYSVLHFYPEHGSHDGGSKVESRVHRRTVVHGRNSICRSGTGTERCL